MKSAFKRFFRDFGATLLSSTLSPVKIIWKGSLEGKCLALTFDDGPDPFHTPKILDALEQSNIQATFFLIGNKAVKYPGIVKEILIRGHEIGNHSFSHNVLSNASIKDIAFELEQTNDVLEQSAGIETSLLRPPYGKLSVPLLRYCMKKRLAVVMWSMDCCDSFKYSSVSFSSKILQTARENDILLMHDDGIVARDIVREGIPRLIDKGFIFARVSNMHKSLNKKAGFDKLHGITLESPFLNEDRSKEQFTGVLGHRII